MQVQTSTSDALPELVLDAFVPLGRRRQVARRERDQDSAPGQPGNTVRTRELAPHEDLSLPEQLAGAVHVRVVQADLDELEETQRRGMGDWTDVGLEDRGQLRLGTLAIPELTVCHRLGQRELPAAGWSST